MKKLNYKKGKALMFILFSAAVVTAVIGSCFIMQKWTAILMICLCFAFIVSGIVVGLVFNRCPHCHALLHFREPNDLYCPHCGKELSKEE